MSRASTTAKTRTSSMAAKKKRGTARVRRPKERRIELRIGIRARVDAVWAALASGSGLCRWYSRDAEVDAREGGTYRFAWGDVEVAGVVSRVQPTRRIDYSWHDGSVVSLRMARRHGGRETVVQLAHSALPATAASVELYAQLRQSWTSYMLNLKTVLERGLDQRERDRRRTFARGWVNCWD